MKKTAVAMEWWQRSDLRYQEGELFFAEQKINNLAEQLGTPSFVYSAARIKDNLHSLHTALEHSGLKKHQIYYAMKANRFAPLLSMLKQSNLCGIDACSPNEVSHAISCGFAPGDISFTAGSLSEQDITTLAKFKGMSINCDSLHAIKRWGELKPGSTIGIRINPLTGIGRSDNAKLHYAGVQTTKFGIYREQFTRALSLTRQYDLQVKRIHFHTGCGYLSDQLQELEKVFEASQWFIQTAGTVTHVNIGGGLGVTHLSTDKALDLNKWASLLADYATENHIHLQIEPGDYIVKDAGLLLLSKTFLETKRETLFLGTDAGFNIAPEPAHYQLPFQPVPLQYHGDDLIPHDVVGNINEALDIWGKGVWLPDMTNQPYLALINAGAYSASMASNHCMRGEFKEFLIQ